MSALTAKSADTIDDMCRYNYLCVFHIKPFFLPVDIQYFFVFLSLSFFVLSVYRASWLMFVVPVIAQHNDMTLYY